MKKKMTLHYGFIVFLSLLSACESQPSNHPFNRTDIQAAAADMRSKSYYGFAILLQMLNATSEPNRDLTFLIPVDTKISQFPIPVDQLEEYLLRHSFRMPLSFEDMSHFPTGTLLPSGHQDRMIRIRNGGRLGYFVNNAQVTAPNICARSKIKCHGIDAVINIDSYARIFEFKEGKSASDYNADPPRRSHVPNV